MKDRDENYKILEDRRDSVRKLVKDVNAKIDEWKNNEAVKKRNAETKDQG